VFVPRVEWGAGVGGLVVVRCFGYVKSRRREGGRVLAAVGASGDKAVVQCGFWHWANMVGVHRSSLGCVLLHVVGCGSTGWIGVA